MMLQTFIVACLISFAGSIPPGSINISVMQLSMQDHRRAAFFLAIGAGVTEFLYAGFTVAFYKYLTDNAELNQIFLSITAAALIILGVYNLFLKTTSKNFSKSDKMRGRAGFTRGVLLGLLNPMTMPFWLAVTSYLMAYNWISLESNHYWMYVVGLTVGTIILLWSVDILGSKFTKVADNRIIVHVVPGLIFIGMGVLNILEILK